MVTGECTPPPAGDSSPHAVEMDTMNHAHSDQLNIEPCPVVVHLNAADDEWEEPHEGKALKAGETVRRAQKTSVASAVFHYVCACVGAGMLSLPRALQECGWIGLILIAFVSLLCSITANYIAQCQFARPGELLRSYEAIGEQAMGKKGRMLVGFFQTITLFGVCTIFLILIGGNMYTLVPSLSLHSWIFIFAGVLIPIAWLKTMKEVTVLAIFGVLASLYVALLITIKGFMQCAHPEGPEPHYVVARWNGLASAVNIIVFSLGSHSVIPNIITHVESPRKNYARVCAWSYFFIAAIYMIVAAAGYAGWGVSTSGNVLVNMNAAGGEVKAAYAFITAHVVLAYPIPLNPLCLALEAMLGIDKHTGARELVPRVVSRTVLVLLTVLVASVVPYFGDILSLVSALSIVVVAFVLPPVFLYKLYPERVFPLHERLLMAFIVLFGLAACGIGLYYAIDGLVNSIQANPSPFDNYF